MKRSSARLLLSIFFFATGFAQESCKKNCSYVCDEPQLGVLAVGYKETDLDTIIVKRYPPLTNFDDPFELSFLYQPNLVISSDSVQIGIARLDQHYNYEVEIPATAQKFRITEIVNENAEVKEGDCETMRGCYNEIVSYKLDGVIKSGNAVVHK